MKHFSNYLIFSLLLWAASAVAQKNTLQLGVFYLPLNENDIAHGAVGYYRQVTKHQKVGLKGMYSSSIGYSANETHVSVTNIDLVHRWTIRSKRGHARWNMEAGISTVWTVQHFPPVTDYWRCITGSSPKQIAEEQKYYDEVLSKWHSERNNYTGIATAANWEYSFSPNFDVGMGLIFNVYFPRQDGWYFLPIPSLNAAYSF